MFRPEDWMDIDMSVSNYSREACIGDLGTREKSHFIFDPFRISRRSEARL
jgi:hypothetical protein